MEDQEALVLFGIGCAIIVAGLRFASVVKRNIEREQSIRDSLPDRIFAGDSELLEFQKRSLLAMASTKLGLDIEEIRLDADLVHDLRVPLGEWFSFLDDLEEHLKIRIDAKNIRTLEDILGLVELTHQ